MTAPLLFSLDSLAAWRRALDRGIEQICRLLDDSKLLDAQAQALAASLRQRLGSDRLVLAFVAEFSRGKSELINALFFADTGRRVLPAAPGRTTMCPVELAWDPNQVAQLSLLPIATRSSGQTLAALRDQPERWQHRPLTPGDAAAMAETLQCVVQTLRVPVDQARALGLWNDEQPDDNPPRDENDLVEVPAWRHALINYPHPLLKRGLVVLDTPGLNAIGTEPELTLALLPSAHAVVFVLAADTGVTRSDLAVWRDHLGDRGCERFVVLNKIDTLADPLLSAAQIEDQVAQQCTQVADTLGVDRARVFPLSARLGLTARVQADEAGLAASRLPALEQALQAHLLPQRNRVVGRMVEDGVLTLHNAAQQRLGDRQRQVADQLAELHGLRGKSGARLKLMSNRLAAEGAEFEGCAPRLAALRSVLVRELQTVMDGLASQAVRQAVLRMQTQSDASFFKLGAARAFANLNQELQGLIQRAGQRADELQQLLLSGQKSLNAEFGFALALAPRPRLDKFEQELQRIGEGYSRYVGVTQVWRLAQPGFMDRFAQMLLSRLRVVFDGVANEIEMWAKSASNQIDDQLRERRRAVLQKRDAHERIRAAEGGLDENIQALQTQHEELKQLAARIAGQFDALCRLAACPPVIDPGGRPGHLHLVPPQPAASTARVVA